MAERPKRPENEVKKPRRFYDDGPIINAPPETKSWEEYEIACKIVKLKAKDLQGRLEALVKEWAEFEGATLKAYKKMPQSDAMFSDGPFSPMRMQSAFRQNLAKLGWKWAAGLPWGPENVKLFIDVVNEACTWGQRILHDQERAAKIEAAKKIAKSAQDDIGKIT